MSEQSFEGAIINGKQFPFVRVTVAMQSSIVRRLRVRMIDMVSAKLFPYRRNLRAWKRVRAIAFVKNPLWKYLRIIPKELRCSQINLSTAGEIQARFFGYVGETVKEHDRHLLSQNPSKTETNQES